MFICLYVYAYLINWLKYDNYINLYKYNYER